MGSTGHGIFKKSRAGSGSDDTFGMANAVNYKGKIPAGSGLEPTGPNKITLKLPITRQSNILFQFKLSKDNKTMTIIGYKDGVPEIKSKVQVDAKYPSLDKVIQTGSANDKQQALKMKDLMNKSSTMSEERLGSISQKLLRDKENKNG